VLRYLCCYCTVMHDRYPKDGGRQPFRHSCIRGTLFFYLIFLAPEFHSLHTLDKTKSSGMLCQGNERETRMSSVSIFLSFSLYFSVLLSCSCLPPFCLVSLLSLHLSPATLWGSFRSPLFHVPSISLSASFFLVYSHAKKTEGLLVHCEQK